MPTIRVGKRHRYTSIDRETLNDSELSFRARGVLTWLLDKPDDWRTTADSIARNGKEGREAIRSALRELEERRYLERRKWRDDSGRWQSEWIVRERPERVSGDGLPVPENRRREPGLSLLKTETENGSTESPEVDPWLVPATRLYDSSPLCGAPWVDEQITYQEWLARG